MKRPWRYWTRARAIRALQVLAHQLGRTPSAREIAAADRWECPSARTIHSMFGTIRKGQQAANLPTLIIGAKRRRSCKYGHDMTNGGAYEWPRTVVRNGEPVEVVVRRCRRCHNADMQRRRALHRTERSRTSPPIKKFYRPSERVPALRLAATHAAPAIAAYWLKRDPTVRSA